MTMVHYSELEYLSQDLDVFDRLVEQHQSTLASLADFTDLDRQNYLAVVLDLYLRIRNISAGIEVLLREGLREPFLLTQRGLFEALATIAYITKHPKKEDEALVFRAYSAIKHIELFPHEPAIVADRKALLARMPAEMVKIARQRSKEPPRSWSGLSIKKMAERASVLGYNTFYAFASAEAHVGTVGDRVLVTNLGDGTARVELGLDIPSKELESGANFARRALKHAFIMLWNTFGGSAVTLPVHDPDLWRQDEIVASSGTD